VIALDTNILVYAHRAESPFHEPARRSVAGLANGASPWAIPWPCLHEFLAVVTHPRIYAPPTPLPRALEQMPQRAVHAALAIRQMVAEAWAAERREPCPEVRLAVHLGTVLVDVSAPNPAERWLPVGETLGLPVRLLGHAAPGEIVVSTPVGRVVEG